jgi:starch phosphorylase
VDIASQLRRLARNLYWTWQPEIIDIFRDLDPVLWRDVNHNPVEFLDRLPPEVLQQRASDLALDARISHAFHLLRDYLEDTNTWGDRYAGPLYAFPVAYFSAEFGLHESLPLYSGGLGVLAGDHLKSASDLGVPVVGVGLFYAQGYFNQTIDGEGWQHERYFQAELDKMPLERATDSKGDHVTISVQTAESTIDALVWTAQVGRNKLILLDSDVESNSIEDRKLTASLYGGGNDVRIRQELLLGVGGLCALDAMGIRPGVLHLNEGHSAFAILEMARQKIVAEKRSFQEIRGEIASRTAFSIHTPVEAGHDRFDAALVEKTLRPLREDMNLSSRDLLSLGRMNPDDNAEPFCMTTLGMRMSNYVNAVSATHQHVTRKQWHRLWPGLPPHMVPIGYITNGIHIPSWIAMPMNQLYKRYMGQNWKQHLCDHNRWEKLKALDPEEFWEQQQIIKVQLVNFIHRRLCRSCSRKTDSHLQIDHDALQFDPHYLIIGFARRFTEYKRANLLLGDLDRLDNIVNHPDKPVRILFSGKAHPADDAGKQLIKEAIEISEDPRFRGKIVFIEDHDINVERHLVQGVDLWLNTPRRPLEACGTSGQKAVPNGTLNCSILDGWWPEAYDSQNGFAIGNGFTHSNTNVQDESDREALYDILENRIIPLFYDRDENGVPAGWIEYQKRAIISLAWRFNADRMVMDYTRKCYLPAAGGLLSDE